MRLLCISILVALSLSAMAHAGTSGDHARAKEIFRQAQQHYKLAEYTEALEGFKETYRILEDPTLLFNIAQCYRQLNKKEEAIKFFRTYLHEVGNVPDRQSVEDIIANLDKQLKQEQAARERSKPQPRPQHIEPQVAPPPATTAPTTTAAAPSHVAAPESRAERKPVYKRWWLWTTVGVVVAAGVGVGLGIGLTHTPPPPSAPTQDGTFKPFSISVSF